MTNSNRPPNEYRAALDKALDATGFCMLMTEEMDAKLWKLITAYEAARANATPDRSGMLTLDELEKKERMAHEAASSLFFTKPIVRQQATPDRSLSLAEQAASDGYRLLQTATDDYRADGLREDLQQLIRVCLTNPGDVRGFIQANYPKEYDLALIANSLEATVAARKACAADEETLASVEVQRPYAGPVNGQPDEASIKKLIVDSVLIVPGDNVRPRDIADDVYDALRPYLRQPERESVQVDEVARAVAESHEGRDWDRMPEFGRDWWRKTGKVLLANYHIWRRGPDG